MDLMPCSGANSARALQCPQPTSQRPGSPFLSQPLLGDGWLPWDLLSCMSSSWPPVTHHSAFGFWPVLKGCPGQAEQTQSLWFSLFLSSSPVKWESGKETSLCKLLVHNCCWVLYLPARPSACHHTAATTLYLSCSFSFFLSLWAFPLLHSLPCCWFLLFFFSTLWSLLYSVLLFLCLYICSPPVFAQACGKHSLPLAPLEPPRGIPSICRRGSEPWDRNKLMWSEHSKITQRPVQKTKFKLIFPLSFNFLSSAGYPGISHIAGLVASPPFWGLGWMLGTVTPKLLSPGAAVALGGILASTPAYLGSIELELMICWAALLFSECYSVVQWSTCSVLPCKPRRDWKHALLPEVCVCMVRTCSEESHVCMKEWK